MALPTPPVHFSGVVRAFVCASLAVVPLWGATAAHAARPLWADRIPFETPATQQPNEPPVAKSRAERLYGALVRVRAVATPNARSNAEVGREREGTGMVIGSDGLILTIGYLVLEAEDVKVTDWRGRTYPTRVLAHDHATGLSLLQTTEPLNIAPVPFGDSSKLANREPVLIAGWGGIADTALAYIVSRRPFAANSEHLLDEAIFTTPATIGWSGAALVDRNGKIVGVGSLLVRQATTDIPIMPGNMFVPIDALKPILADLVKFGRRQTAPRPWLGVVTEEASGRLIVSEVSPESPAQRAGVQKGDIILAVGADPVGSHDDFYRKLWTSSSAGDVITLRVLQGTEIHEIDVISIGRDEYFRPGRPSTPDGTVRTLDRSKSARGCDQSCLACPCDVSARNQKIANHHYGS